MPVEDAAAVDSLPAADVSPAMDAVSVSVADNAIAGADWLAWRGPSGKGVAVAGQQPPTEWSETKNIVWKSTVPGRGHSSPIVAGSRVLLTTADEGQQVQSVVCFDRASGKQLWQTEVSRGGFPGRIHSKNTHASPTLACDGNHAFAVFCHHDTVQVTALDLDGGIVWQADAGAYQPRQYEYGYAPSPVLHGDAVIVAADFESGYLAALDKATGREVWRTPRPRQISYSSPIVARVGGRDQLLISGAEQLASYDPTTGKALWSAGVLAHATCGTVVWEGDVIYASGGYPKKETAAVSADGRVLWRNSEKCYEQSMLVHDGYLYAMNDNGIAFCWRAADGQEMWKERLGGPVSASPILADGNIYAANERGTCFVFRANPQRFELVAQNQLGDEAFATPTICGGQIFLRVADSLTGSRQETLYCIGMSEN